MPIQFKHKPCGFPEWSLHMNHGFCRMICCILITRPFMELGKYRPMTFIFLCSTLNQQTFSSYVMFHVIGFLFFDKKTLHLCGVFNSMREGQRKNCRLPRILFLKRTRGITVCAQTADPTDTLYEIRRSVQGKPTTDRW